MIDRDTIPRAVNLPAAAREQEDVTGWDLELTELARRRHPAVRWWWGERVVAGRNGAYCYLCDGLTATWARSWPTPREAIDLVLLHRSGHIDSILLPHGNDTAGTSPAGVAPSPEGQE